jgi:hypothetical protein
MGSRKAQKRQSGKTPLIFGLEVDDALQAFEMLANALHIEVRYEKGDFESGLCRVGDKQVILIKKEGNTAKMVSTLARELAILDMSDIYVTPTLQRIMDEFDLEG